MHNSFFNDIKTNLITPDILVFGKKLNGYYFKSKMI